MCTKDGMSSYSLYSSCKFKTWQKERQGIKLETTAFYSDIVTAQTIQKCEVQKIKLMWNKKWLRTGPHTVCSEAKRIHSQQKQNIL